MLMYILNPMLKLLLHGLIFFCDQRAMSLLIEHLVESSSRLALSVVIALFRFAILQDELCDPLFTFAVLALEHGAGAMRAWPALPALLGLLFIVGLLFVGHDVVPFFLDV